MDFLSMGWLRQHLSEIENKAGKRYTPELNVELPISEIFDGLSRTKIFYTTVQSHYGKLLKNFKSITTTHKSKKIQRTFDSFARSIREILDILVDIREYNTEQISWDKLKTLANKAQSSSYALYEQIRKEGEKPAAPFNPEDPHIYPKSNADILNYDLDYISEVQRELRFFVDFCNGTSAKTSNRPFLMINGLAGSGKTHLLCDLVKHRIDKGYAPTVLSFGEFFENNNDIWFKMAKQFGLDPVKWNKTKLLKELNRKGRTAKSRSVLMIDALNESRPLSFWNKKLGRLVEDIRKYPNVALVVTIRSGFESDVLGRKAKKLFVHQEHRGFEFQEWEAVTKFFKEFCLPLPEIPLLTPEFQNPLFLLLFCRAFEDSVSKKSNKSFRGHNGATHIFEKYVDSVSKKIERKFMINHGPGKNIWDTVIERIAKEMVDKNVDRLLETNLLNLIKKSHSSINAEELLAECEKNFLLVKVPHYVSEKNTSEGFDYRFPFQRFSDHLIGRFLFKKYEKEFGKANKNITTATCFFSKQRKLGKFLSREVNRGIIEALFIQCPEQLGGIEFFEVAPYLDGYLATHAFVQSVIWREPTAFSSDLKKPIDFINKKVLAYGDVNAAILNAFLSVSVVPGHPFNAEFLHSQLMKKSMPTRDAWWSVFLHDEYKNRDAVDRLLRWSWSDQNLSHLTDDSIFLASVALSWFLTTSNRFVRDKATKGLVSLIQNRLHLIKKLLVKFEAVDDPYVTERLLAVAYGCALRNPEDISNIKSLATYIYKRFFKSNNPPVHALIRDYARGIIEVARINKINFRYSIRNTEPPYRSVWPKKVPSAKTLKKKYSLEDYSLQDNGFRTIWSSLTFDDFGRYEIEPHLGAWSGRRLKRPVIDRREVYEKFKKTLTKSQNNLLRNATNPSFGVDLSSLMANMAEKLDKKEEEQKKLREKRERREFLMKFKNSITSKQCKYFENKIEPFLDNRGSINDPYERFDTSFAQRWIFNRVIKLGFNPKLHGGFDNRVNRYYASGRSNHKAERIGKKYQWIALHEFTALVSDHFEFKGRYWGNRTGNYRGTWNPYIRDIDPSLLIQNDSKIKYEAQFDTWKNTFGHYDGWLSERSDLKWLQKKSDLPDPKKIINIIDDSGERWLVLRSTFVWQQGTPPDREKYDYPTRELFYILKSFIIKKKDLNVITNWALNKGYGNWLPESHDWYEAFIGEFPNSSSFEDIRGDYNIWTKANNKEDSIKNISVIVCDDAYLNEFTLDCSRDENISIMLPSKYLVNKMKLKHPELDGRFRNKAGDLIAYTTSVSEENNPSTLVIKEKSFLQFLNKHDYAIFWTMLGEKQIIGGSRYGRDEYRGRLEICGIYYLDKNVLTGKKKSNFNK